MRDRVSGLRANDLALLIIRLAVASVIFAHGAQKLLGIFGGHGPHWTVRMFNEWFGLPAALVWVLILSEFFAPLALMLGLLSRWMSMTIICIMISALYYVHWQSGFFMNWYSIPDQGEGFEYHLLIIAMCAAIIVAGGGKYSMDNWIAKRQGVNV